ncbi:hypothetical protein TWF718_009661 [Orbilia javanica]|uniref:Uncharacterized protein n=1 Tax=Orbilia javanica TaxID=47235 RepID=A0AAN8MSV4_9PEZI
MDISDDGGTQEDTEMQLEDQPIYLMACDCSELFTKCLDSSSKPPAQFLSSEVARFVQEYQDRFNAWVSFLTVFAGEKECLDHRLRHHPALQDMVIRLLDILRRNLFLVSGYNYEESTTAPQSSSNTIDAAGDNIIKDALPSHLSVAFSGIEESITRLNKLGIAIRLSSRSTVVARARNFASQNPELIRLSEFEDRAYLALQSLYPNASDTLRQQLADAMTDRYAKLRYEFYRTRAQDSPGLSVNAPSSSPSSQKLSALDPPPTKFTNKQNTTPPVEEKQHITVNFRSFPQSSIDTSRLDANLKEIVATGTFPKSKPPKTLTVHTNRQREPPCPKFNSDKDYTRCDWCSQIIGRSLTHIWRSGYTGWSEEGRNDLQPYVCIAEECSKSRPTYSSSRDWFKHMISSHSEYWSQNIHSEWLWECPVKHENDSAYIFSSRDEFHNHIVLQHESDGLLKIDEGSLDMAKHYGVESLHLASSCPLCLFRLEADPLQDDDPDDGIPATDASQVEKKRPEFHRRSVKRVKLSSNTVEANKVATSWAMGSHIAEHLHHSMIVSLQLMSAMDGASYGEDDERSDPDSPSSRVSALGHNQLENRLEDLPSEVQGSIAWSEVDESLSITGLIAEKNDLKTEVDNLITETNKLVMEIDDVEATMTNLITGTNNLKAIRNKLEAEENDLKTKKGYPIRDKNDLETDQDNLRTKEDSFEMELETARNSLRIRIKDLKAESDNIIIEKEKGSLIEETSDLTKEKKHLKTEKEKENLMMEIMDLKRRQVKLEAERNYLEARRADLITGTNNLRAELDKLEAELDKLEAEKRAPLLNGKTHLKTLQGVHGEL